MHEPNRPTEKPRTAKRLSNGLQELIADDKTATKVDRLDILVPGTHATPDGCVEVGNHEFADEVIHRLPTDTLYRRGGAVGEVVGERGKKVFFPIASENMRIHVDRNARLVKWLVKQKRNGPQQKVLTYAPCTRDQGLIVLAACANDPRIREIRMLTNYPTYLPGFTLSRPGFHDGVFYDPPPELANIPIETDVEKIAEVVDDLVIDFPFKEEADRHNFYGMLLTPILQPAIQGNRPLGLINSPLERTGKSKLAEDIMGGTILGNRTPAMQMSENAEEMDKRIIGLLMSGATLLHLDNLREYVDSPVLASLLTASVYQGRILGGMRMPSLPNTLTVLATGNNVRATGEIVKRAIPICLQPRSDRPEERDDFRHADCFAYAVTGRRRVLGCLLGMVEVWKRAGMPHGRIPMGGFDAWASVVGGIMEVCGFHEWMGNVKDWRGSADTRKQDLSSFVESWHQKFKTGHARVSELLAIAKELELFPEVLGNREGRAAETAFGMRVLARNKDVPVGNFVICRSDLTRPAVYFLKGLK